MKAGNKKTNKSITNWVLQMCHKRDKLLYYWMDIIWCHLPLVIWCCVWDILTDPSGKYAAWPIKMWQVAGADY